MNKILYRDKARAIVVAGQAMAALLLLGGCVSPQAQMPPWQYETDQARNPWPAACRHDLAPETAHVPIVWRARAAMVGINGLTFFGGNPGGESIVIADDLRGWLLEDVLHHERCHIVAGIDWHPRPKYLAEQPRKLSTDRLL